MKQRGFVLIDIIVGLALMGLLISTVFPSIASTKVGLSRIEKRAIVIDQAQRIAQTIKHPNETNNNIFCGFNCGDSIEYKDDLLNEDLEARIYIDSIFEHYEVYSVEVKFLGDGISAKFQVSRNME